MCVRRSINFEKTGTGIRKISSIACGFSSFKIHYSVNKINEVYVFYSIKYHNSIILLKTNKKKKQKKKKKKKRSLTSFIVSCGMLYRLFRCNRTCYCIGMVSVTSASRYQRGPSMFIRGLIPRKWPRQFRLLCPCFYLFIN